MDTAISSQVSEASKLEGGAQQAWPELRQELTLHKGPPDGNGATTWTLHDPVRNQYFSIDWISFHILSRLRLGGIEAIKNSIEASTPIQVDEQEIKTVLEFLDANELIRRHDPQATAWLTKKKAAQSKSLVSKLIHGYLFFRVPLFRPDALLSRLVQHMEIFFTPFFFRLTFLAFLIGLWGVFRQWDVFSATLVDTFSWHGVVGYAGALIAVKILHELGHAFTAKRMGCRVPTIGVAFLVMFPMAYTDVTESWKLDSNTKRFNIAGAGIATELIVAAWMLLLWSLLPEGTWRGVAFFLATTSLTATLLINASPFMRFDGYFLLSDMVGMPNLHQRAFALGKWWMREKLFKFGDAPPEHFPTPQLRMLVLFAFVVWLYRFIIFIGIAVLIYHFFFKALGIFLFIVEIWFFLARPIMGEFSVWYKRKNEISEGFTKRPAHFIFWAIILFLIVPFDLTVNTQGMLKPEQIFNFVTHVPARVVGDVPTISTKLSAGDVLMRLDSPEVDHQIKLSKARIDSLARQVGSAGFQAETKAQQTILREQLANAENALEGHLSEKRRLTPIAPFGGEIVEVQQDLRVGDWVPKGMSILTFIDESSWVVDSYVEESDLERIAVGNWGRFLPDTPGLPALFLKVIAIDKDRSRSLGDPQLSAGAGGHILVREQKNVLIPERAIYRVRLEVLREDVNVSKAYLRGSVVILGWPRSILGEFLRGSAGTLIRELGF